MSLDESKVPERKSSFEPVPARVHYARCAGLIDLGVQVTTYKGQEKPPTQQVDILFELPYEKITIEKEGEEARVEPRWMSKRINIAKGEKATLTRLKAKLGISKITDIIDMPVMLSVVHETYEKDGDTRKFAKIDDILPFAAPMDHTGQPNTQFVMPELKNGTRIFDFDAPSKEVFDMLPEFQQDYIRKATNFNEIADKVEGATADAPPVAEAPPVTPQEESTPVAPVAPPVAPVASTGTDDPF